MAIPAQMIVLDRQGERTLQQQIQQSVADSILTGRFRPGERMPSSRDLAKHLDVARITVTLAYTELVANDFLIARGRSGYFVSENAPAFPAFSSPPKNTGDLVDWDALLGDAFSTTAGLVRPPNWRDYKYPFIYGQSDPNLFDHRNWRQCALEALGRKDFESLTIDRYQRDDPLLIEYILRHLLLRRGISARPEEVLLTMGAQNALWIASELLLNKDRKAVIENPHYPGLRDILARTGCSVERVDVDEKGLPPDDLPDNANVVFTTASHQCPTNVTMPLDRRRALLARAARDKFIIIEDDYESEMSFSKPSPALKSLDDAGCVVHVGSFSKTIFPGLRLGYIVAPARFIEAARNLRTVVLRHPPGHTQRTVAYFLSLGHHATQSKRMDQSFRQRRAEMEAAIEQHGLTKENNSISGGSSFWMKAPEEVDTTKLSVQLRSEGVLIEPGEVFFGGENPPKNYYRLAYSSIASARIPEGIERLAKGIKNLEP